MQALKTGVALGGIGLVALWLIQIVVYLLRDKEIGDAVGMSTTNLSVAIGSLVGLIVTGVVSVADLFDVVLTGLSTHPFAAAQSLTVLLGVVGIHGGISTLGFVIGAAVIAAGILINMEVQTS